MKALLIGVLLLCFAFELSNALDPVALTSVTATASAISIEWGAVTGAEYYRLEIYVTTDAAPGAADDQITLLQHDAITATGGAAIQPNTEYTIVVHAHVDDPAETSTGTQNIRTKPGVPTNVVLQAAAGDAATTSVIVSWTVPANGADDYIVTLSDGTTATVAASPHTFSSLEPATAYTATVTATNANGNGDASAASASVSTAALSPVTISILTATATQITVEWTAVSGAAHYKVDIHRAADTSTGPPATEISSTQHVTTTDSGGTNLAPNTEYTIVVHAYVGSSETTGTQNIFTKPGAPTNVMLALPDGETAVNSITVSWTAPTNGAVSYIVQLSDGTVTTDHTAQTSPLTISDLTPATSYSASVIAVNSNGNSDASADSAAVSTAQCTAPLVATECACRRTCTDVANNVTCPETCTAGSGCACSGSLIEHEGQCIAEANCPCDSNTDADCKGFSHFHPYKGFLLPLALLFSILFA